MTGGETGMHLAQVNVGRLRYPPDDPRMAEFIGALDRVNRIADRMPGFVWRLKGEAGNDAIDVAWPGDPALNVNLSVWESVEAFEAFVWRTVHRRFYERKAEWFEALTERHLAFWWIEPGHVPTLAEAVERLARLRAEGPGEHAFGWEHLARAEEWRERRCA